MSTRNFSRLILVLAGALGGVLISLGITAVAQRGDPLPLRDLQQFANVFSAIKNSYVESVTDEQLMQDAIRGLFTELDPHSTYLDAEAFKEMEDITQGGFGGLGIEIGSEGGMPKVIAPIEETPAARAGILSGDIITHIDDKPTKDMTLNEAVKLMRGEPKTSVQLTIQREGRDEPLKVDIVRDHIKVRSVRARMLDDDIAYIRVSQFQERTETDLARHVQEMADKKAKGLILDLRNDPGGLLESAIGVSSLFMRESGVVVSTKGRIASANRDYHTRTSSTANQILRSDRASGSGTVGEWAETVPMVVLVNVGSASASEIVAGALQDYGRATVMGNRTFGKGSVQSVLPLGEDTGIKLTTARYYTPKGRSIQVTGVRPDIVVDDTAEGNLFRLPREGDLDHHLINGAVPEVGAETEGEDEDYEVIDDPVMFEFGSEDDYQLSQAINLLENRPVRRNNPSDKDVAAKSDTDDDADESSNNKDDSSQDAEKKSPVNERGRVKTLRYRVTPEGLIRIQDD